MNLDEFPNAVRVTKVNPDGTLGTEFDVVAGPVLVEAWFSMGGEPPAYRYLRIGGPVPDVEALKNVGDIE